jgi:opacity protein-like surface antigen
VQSGVEKETDFKENVNTFNIAPLIGLEYNLENKMFVDARYNFGISNISKIASKETISFLQVGIGYKF